MNTLNDMAGGPPLDDDPGQRLTAEILQLAGELLLSNPPAMALEETLKGIMCAYVSLALFAGTKDYAKQMLQDMSNALDDQATQDAIFRGVEGLKGGNA